MSVSPARAAAFAILLRVQREDAYASELLNRPGQAKLSAADQRLATELVMGTLRWQSLIDQEIAGHSSQRMEKLDAEVLVSLRMAAYQLLFLSRVPGHAAVHESVELVKSARKVSAAGFVNAVLRKLAGSAAKGPPEISLATSPTELAQRSAHPLWLVERWERELGLSAARAICEYDQQVPQAAIRLNSGEAERELLQEGIQLAPGALLASARRVQSGEITKSRACREMRVTIQDEASQLVALMVGHGRRILDCCAAPGGKTRMLAGGNPESEITAVELHPHRARVLRKLVAQKNVRILVGDVANIPVTGSFDRVLADVPCSGTGTLARNPEIKWRLKAEDIVQLHKRQFTILRAAMQRVERGGRLVYSTCSLEREENQQVVERALAAEPSFVLRDCKEELERLRADGELTVQPDTLLSGFYLRTIPGLHRCDGFFAAVLEKR